MAVSVDAPSGGRKRTSHLSKQGLSPGRAGLVRLLQGINFGRVEGLRVVGGEPVLDPRPTVVREHKFGGDNGPRPELRSDDFLLKQQVLELCTMLDDLQDGVIDVLEVKHGLPFRMILREVAA